MIGVLKNDWDLISYGSWIKKQEIVDWEYAILSIDSELENLKTDFPYLKDHLVIAIIPQKFEDEDGSIRDNGLVTLIINTKYYSFKQCFSKTLLASANDLIPKDFFPLRIRRMIIKYSKQAKEKGLITINNECSPD